MFRSSTRTSANTEVNNVVNKIVIKMIFFFIGLSPYRKYYRGSLCGRIGFNKKKIGRIKTLPTFFDKELNYFVLNRIILSILCHSADIGENNTFEN